MTKHMGAINSDAAINRYQHQYDQMVTRYRLKVEVRIPLWRRAWRRLLGVNALAKRATGHIERFKR